MLATMMKMIGEGVNLPFDVNQTKCDVVTVLIPSEHANYQKMLTNIVVSYSCYFPSRFNAFQTLFRKVAKGSIQVTSIDYRATTIAFSGKSYIQVREFFVMNSFKTIPEHLAEMNGSDYSKTSTTFS